MDVIVSTVGTSVLTNAADDATRSLLREHANHTDAELDTATSERFTELQLAVGERLADHDQQAAIRAAAELAVLLPLIAERRDQRRQHWLVHSDTLVGRYAAELLAGYLDAIGEQVQKLQIDGLNTAGLDSFRSGVTQLARWCATTLPDHHAAGDRVVFNVAGGFKTLSGYLQTIGMFYADEVVYTFEGSEQLLRVPRLPVSVELTDQQARLLRELKLHLGAADDVRRDLPEALFDELDDLVELSAYGEIIFERVVENGRYRTEVLDPPHPRVRFGDGFRRSIDGFDASRLRLINLRVDDLVRFVTSNGQTNPRRLDAKRVKGTAAAPSTHEFDAWSDRDAKRGYFHYEQQDGEHVLVIDRIGAHL